MIPSREQIEAKCKQVGPCLVWQGATSSGREPRPIWHIARQRVLPVRRLLLEHRNGEPLLANQYACCVCPFDTAGCVTHIKALTRKQQVAIAIAQGKVLSGEARSAINREAARKVPRKMTLELADALRQRRQEGATYCQLGSEFGIHFSMAARICKNAAWVRTLPPVQRAQTPPGRFEPAPGFERAISNDWMLRRQGVDVRAQLATG